MDSKVYVDATFSAYVGMNYSDSDDDFEFDCYLKNDDDNEIYDFEAEIEAENSDEIDTANTLGYDEIKLVTVKAKLIFLLSTNNVKSVMDKLNCELIHPELDDDNYRIIGTITLDEFNVTDSK